MPTWPSRYLLITETAIILENQIVIEYDMIKIEEDNALRNYQTCVYLLTGQMLYSKQFQILAYYQSEQQIIDLPCESDYTSQHDIYLILGTIYTYIEVR